MNYIGEHLLPGQIGHFFSLLFLVSAGVATIAFFMGSGKSAHSAESASWQALARKAFLVETVSVLALFGTLYYIISHNYFEYKYAFDHLNTEMPMKYIFSCMWEGQEGSFLLWIFWQMVLHLLILKELRY